MWNEDEKNDQETEKIVNYDPLQFIKIFSFCLCWSPFLYLIPDWRPIVSRDSQTLQYPHKIFERCQERQHFLDYYFCQSLRQYRDKITISEITNPCVAVKGLESLHLLEIRAAAGILDIKSSVLFSKAALTHKIRVISVLPRSLITYTRRKRVLDSFTLMEA